MHLHDLAFVCLVLPFLIFLMLCYIRNYPGVTAALSVLLRWDINDRPKPYECPFSLYPVQHPLISLLKQNRDTWPDVFRLLQNFLFQSDKR